MTVTTRVRDLKCEKCGRPFIASDFDTDGDDIITLTCARCYDRPVEIETQKSQ